ncbi:MAG: class I SAM-dependent methyltransferase [Desulfobacterales bacterium]|nr:class I SAM-dependent methyltransferase [Desulfobacterales bacterium]
MTDEKTNNTCPICNASVNQINRLYLLGLIDSTTYRCSGCGVYFRQPLPDEKAVAQYYTSRYFRHPDEIEQQMAKVQGSWIIHTLKQCAGVNLNNLHYVEFGAGRGWLVSFMQKQNMASAIGYEPDNTSVQWGRNQFQIDLREGFLENALQVEDFSHGRQVIGIAHVLEHLHNPLDVLETIKARYQRPYLFLEVPDAVWEGPIMELETSPQSSMGQHFWSFTEQSLNILLNRSGFSVISCQKGGIPHFWNNHLDTLKIWKTISAYHQGWQYNQISIKKEIIASLNIAGKCLSAGIRMRLRRLQKKNYNRIDLPIIRILAKAVQ